MADMPHYYWIWDRDLGQFVYNQELTDISMFSYVSIDEEHKCISAFSRFGWSEQVMIYLEYIDEIFTEVEMITWEYYFTSEDVLMQRITVTDFVSGTESVTCNEVEK